MNAIAEAAGKSAGQVLIRWAVQQGVISSVSPPFPPSVRDRLYPRVPGPLAGDSALRSAIIPLSALVVFWSWHRSTS